MKLARLTVDLDALRANYRLLAAQAKRTAAVVKADGYGLGAAPVFKALCREGCADFFVATVEEGLELREVDPDAHLYVFSGPPDAASAAAMAAHDLTPVLNDVAQVAHWRPHRDAPVAVHVDTGMNRLGFNLGELRSSTFKGLNVVMVLSHLANADDPADLMNARQSARFKVARRLFPGALTSLGNSAGTLNGDVGDLARPGIALYGGNPFSTGANPMHTVATLEAKVLALRDVVPGEPVGYGGAYTTSTRIRVAVLGMGYADGARRWLRDAEVAYQGTRLPVVGRISMDTTQVDATAVADNIALGDWVEIFGRTLSVDEAATRAGTISYELLTGIGSRVGRCYTGD